jgi:hypothetical protein
MVAKYNISHNVVNIAIKISLLFIAIIYIINYFFKS